MNRYFVGVDLGATSGRVILATLCGDGIALEVLHRFPNRLLSIGGKYYWNIYSLYEEILHGLTLAGQRRLRVDSIGIDTWGVDMACVAADGTLAGLPRAYRDPYTNGVPEEFFRKIPRQEVYRRTGIQIMNFNSLFQLRAARGEGMSALENAASVLFMPDALSYLLTGEKVCEYTILSTSQFMEPRTREIDGALLRWLHRFIGGFIGRGGLLLPFALFALSALLFLRPKGPVRLRGACIGLLPLLFGGIVHAITCANEYDFSMKTIRNLLETGMESHSGGLLSGMLYIVLEWALSSAGALIVLLLLTFAAIMVACRITPMMLIDMFRPPEYEYEDEEERARYEEPVQLPNVHEVAREINAAHAQKREERRARRQAADFDIPIDSNPPGEDKPGGAIPPVYPAHEEGKPLAPDEYLRGLKKPREEKREEQPDSIMELVANRADEPEAEPEADAAPAEPAKPAAKPKKTESISEDEQAAMNDAMDESQKAPAPVYAYPPIDLLTQGKHASMAGAESELRESSACLLDTLESFNIDAQIIGIVRGPSVTRFELTIPRGIKISRITALSDDIALSLGAANVRIAPIPDKSAVGIEVPNKTVNTVFIRECIGSNAFANAKSRLSFAVGKDITGRPVIGDIAKMPHMLIAGSTGSGKSVCINTIIASFLYKARPDEVKLVLVDPKVVELANYNGIPHLLIPVVTEPSKAAAAQIGRAHV